MAKTRTLLFFFKDPRGGTALEAALILPVFLIFLLGVCEMGLVFWGNSMIRNSLSQVAFESSRGCIEGNIDRMSGDCMDPGSAITRARLDQIITQNSLGMINAGTICFTAAPIATAPNTLTPATNVNLGIGEETIVYYASYDWPVYFKQLNRYLGNQTRFRTMMVVRNESFGSLPNVVRVSARTGNCV